MVCDAFCDKSTLDQQSDPLACRMILPPLSSTKGMVQA